MYIYKCGDITWSGAATIGYNGGPVGDFFANHPMSGVNTNIACSNSDETEWTTVVYKVSTEVYIPTEQPPTVEPRKTNN